MIYLNLLLNFASPLSTTTLWNQNYCYKMPEYYYYFYYYYNSAGWFDLSINLFSWITAGRVVGAWLVRDTVLTPRSPPLNKILWRLPLPFRPVIVPWTVSRSWLFGNGSPNIFPLIVVQRATSSVENTESVLQRRCELWFQWSWVKNSCRNTWISVFRLL